MRLLNTKQVQEYLGISETSTYKMFKDPACPVLKVGGRYKIFEEDLKNYLIQNNKKTEI